MSEELQKERLKERIESAKYLQNLSDKDFVIAARIILIDPAIGQSDQNFIDREIRLRMLLKGGVSL